MRATDADLEDLEVTNARFREDAERHDLRFRCEDCCHLTYSTGLCSLGYPNPWLKGELRSVQPDGSVAFCKYFELGEGG